MFASDTLAALAIEGWIGAPPEDGMLFARPLRVLVTQDDPDLLDLLTLSLERGGFEVIACRDVATASALLAATEPDAIVTDLQMPDVESFGVFRNEPRNPVIPVVALTTNEQDAAVQALATPGVTVVRKVEAAAVARTLRDAVRAVQVGLGGEGTVPASDGVDEALTIVGRHPAYRHGDVPVTAEAARDVLAFALGVPLSELEKLSGDSAGVALARLQRLVHRLLSVSGVMDELTGGLRRDVGLDAARRELERARRTGQQAVFAMLDVDGLKTVNDSGGHLAGDQLLRSTGNALRTSLRSYDLVVRYGGDEFFCMLSDASLHEAEDRFNEVSRDLEKRTGRPTVSVGLTIARPGDTLEDCIARADEALYAGRAKRRGGVGSVR